MEKTLVGQRFGRLVVIKIDEVKEYSWFNKRKNKINITKHIRYECRCDCGNIARSFDTSLLRGRTRSCGCFKDDTFLDNLGYDSHGKSRERIYRIWGGMKQRCSNKNLPYYKNYGGRGIKVCEEWLSFPNFYKDMGDPPSLEYTLERINNDGNYEPSNCKWATRAEQQRNRRPFKWASGDNHWSRRKKLGLSPLKSI